MPLTKQQRGTLKYLQSYGITGAAGIIQYCEGRLKLPQHVPGLHHSTTRKHPDEYYKQIITLYQSKSGGSVTTQPD